MASNDGIITRKQVIEDEALNWGPEYAKQVQLAIDKNKEFVKGLIELNNASKQIKNASNNSEYVKGKTQVIEITKKLGVVWREQIQLENQLITTKKKNQLASEGTNRAVIQERETLRQTNLEIKRSLTAMGKLTSLRDKAKKTIQELNAQTALGNQLSNKQQKELKESTTSFEKYNKAITGIKKTTGDFTENVGNYPKMFGSIVSGLKQLVPALGVIQTIRFALDFSKEARQFAIEAKGIEFAFDKIGSKAEIAFEKVKKSTRGFLSELDIKKSIVEFDNFNLDVEELDGLLEFVSIRATQTGKSFEYLKDSLVEGLSKESKLRIDNLGISAAELNEELKKTPNFVKAVANIAKKEVAEAGSILDDAANSQAKWNADYENFQLLVGKGAVAKVSNAFYDMGSNILRAITPIKDFTKEVKEEQIGLNTLVTQITDVNISNKDRLKLIEDLNEKYPFFLEMIDSENVTNEELATTLDEVNQLYIKRIVLQTQQNNIEALIAKAGERAFKNTTKKIDLDKKLTEINLKLGLGLTTTGKSFEENSKAVFNAIKASDGYINASTRKGVKIGEEAAALSSLNALITQYEGGLSNASNINKDIIEEQDLMKKIEGELSITLAEINELFKINSERKKENTKGTKELTDSEIKALEARKKLLLEDAYQLKKYQIEQEIKFQDEIADNEKESAGNRLNAIQERIEKELELAELNKNQLLKNEQLTADGKKLIIQKYLDEIKVIEKDGSDQSTEIIINLKINFDTEELSDDVEIVKQGIKAYANILGLDGEKALQEFTDLHGENFDKIAEYYENLDYVAEESAARRKELEKNLAEATVEFANVLLDRKIAKIDDEITANDDKYALLLAAAQNDDVQRALIEEEAEKKRQELEKKKRQEQRKQAILNKAISAGMAIANTAMAAAATIAPPPIGLGPVFGPALLPLVFANGALQLATILAQPIPKYKMGRKGGPEEIAITGEERTEVITDKFGNNPRFTPNKPTLTFLNEGDQVHRSVDDYYKLQRAAMMSSIAMEGRKTSDFQTKQYFDDSLDKERLGIMKETLKAIQRQKTIILKNKIDIPHSMWKSKNTN